MNRKDLHELHYITPIATVPSILRDGILCHRLAAKVPHESIAMQEIQDRRAKVTVPGGRRLHEYANLYFDARNPMLYVRLHSHETLCVLRVNPGVLDLPGVVITDGNASSDYIRFAAAPSGLSIVDEDLTYAEDWTHPDRIEYFRRKCAKCAEVLVPDRVQPNLIAGAYVSCQDAVDRLSGLGVRVSALIKPTLFFR